MSTANNIRQHTQYLLTSFKLPASTHLMKSVGSNSDSEPPMEAVAVPADPTFEPSIGETEGLGDRLHIRARIPGFGLVLDVGLALPSFLILQGKMC
jgi:hypothetical protein